MKKTNKYSIFYLTTCFFAVFLPELIYKLHYNIESNFINFIRILIKGGLVVLFMALIVRFILGKDFFIDDREISNKRMIIATILINVFVSIIVVQFDLTFFNHFTILPK